ncbi:MFS transporter [Epilithonimonas lactis]|uniref:Membrane protein n=1 Tax=Epilithonimonas lactis TaxID=421072 RepID=A0A085B673_9FLAO|nr:MFS transporter [Epilithonimonas lactis]KFC17968.1 membrane protein [Epilithonimonas lactis]SEP90232.1 MFS transporter, DHA1 family, arabinose polymer transporter [Epilithonimonas lactis]
MDKRIFPLALGGLAIGTTEFVIMGLLPDVAHSLKISIPQAGHLISAYAAGVVVGAPILVAYAAKFPPKRILIFLMIAFTLFNGLSALVSDYYTMMAVRFMSGLPHGAFFGVGAVVSSRLAKPGKQAQSIAMMFTGLTVANLAMVPFVTWLGHQLSWRYAFGVVALIGLLTLVFLKFLLPYMDSLRTTTLKDELEFFKTQKSWHIIAITAIGFGGLFAWFSYITPLMTNVSKFPTDFIAYIMILAGAGMVIGNFLGAIMADKMRPALAAAILLSAMILALVGVFFFSENKIASLILTFVCGVLSMAVGTPVNIIMLRSARNSEMMAAAFMQAAFNVGNSIGAFFGGLPLEFGLSYNYPSLVGAGLAMTGFILCLTFIRKYKPVI